MTDEQWKRGFRRLEFLVKEAARLGDEIWPPSYAGFLGYCEKSHGERAHKLFKQEALPDKSAQEQAKIKGREQISLMKNLFQ